MNETEITIILPTAAAKEIFFDGWLHGFEPSAWLKKSILNKLSRPVQEEATPATGGGTRRSSSAAPTAAQAAELERQRALYSRPAPGRELEACKIRIPEDAE